MAERQKAIELGRQAHLNRKEYKMPRFVDFGLKSFAAARTLLSNLTPRIVRTAEASPNSIIEVAGIIFTGAAGAENYHPLYDRQPKPGYPSGSNINPPQWLKSPAKNEPTAYTKNTVMTIKLDISGTYDTPIWVKVTPSGQLTSDSTSITFSPSYKIIQVTNWATEDYNNLTFSSNALPNEVRIDSLSISWNFQYGYSQSGPWNNAGGQTTEHQLYVTYARPYYLFSPFYRPWKQIMHTACSYADGATTTIQASCMVTSGIYNSLSFYYVSYSSHSDYDNSWIHLWEMLGDGWVDCKDGSNYYTVLMRWLGISAQQVKIDTSAPDDDFQYKYIRPITTSSDLQAGWVTGTWNYHQVGILTNVYDSIIMVDRQGTPRVPANMDKPTYSGYVYDSGVFNWQSNALVTSVH